MYIKNKRGQSTVEYILLVTAVIAVVIAFTASGGIFQGNLENVYNIATDDIGKGVNKLHDGHALSNVLGNDLPIFNFDITK